MMQKKLSEDSFYNDRSKSQLEQVVRMDSSQRRRSIHRMNEKVRVKNMEITYKMKTGFPKRVKPDKRQSSQRVLKQD